MSFTLSLWPPYFRWRSVADLFAERDAKAEDDMLAEAQRMVASAEMPGVMPIHHALDALGMRDPQPCRSEP